MTSRIRRPDPDADRPRPAPAADLPPRRPPLRTVALLVIGAVFGAVATLTWTAGPSVRVVEGTVGEVEGTGVAMRLSEPADLADTGLGLVGILWREGDAAWTRGLSDAGFPSCIRPGDEGLEVLLGLVLDPGGGDRPPSEVVAWVQCPPR